jgi:hypothetical protein
MEAVAEAPAAIRGQKQSGVGVVTNYYPRRKNCSTEGAPGTPMMTHKYRGCIVVLSISKSVEPNEEQKVLTSDFDQGFTINTSKQVFRDIW